MARTFKDKEVLVRGEVICSRTFTLYRLVQDAFQNKLRLLKPTAEEEYTCIATKAVSLALLDILSRLPREKRQQLLPEIIGRLDK